MFSLQKLLGKNDKFFELLEASIQEAVSSIRSLSKFIQNPAETRTLDEFIAARRKEKAIASKIGDELCKTFVTALDKEDIEALSSALYRIPKNVQRIAERILIAPHLLKDVNLERHLVLLEKAAMILTDMIKELKRSVNLENMKNLNDSLQAVEREADHYLFDLLKSLYQSNMEAVRLIFLVELYELLERVADRCRDAGNVIVHIALKNS
jgi:uncharacterized protein Yka (UPF0111/DUF47 family)